MLNKEQMVAILQELHTQTAHHRMAWSGEGAKVWIDLPKRLTVELVRAADEGLTASVKRGSEEILGNIRFSATELSGEMAEIQSLYEVAAGAATRAVYAEIIDSIKRSGSSGAELVKKLPPAEEVRPEQSVQILKRMAGRWNLDFSRGKEIVRINEDGAYFIEGKTEPKFQLVVLAANETTKAVEVAKDTLDGRRFQIEYLVLAPDQMTGYAKHDGHRLVYSRMKD